MPTKPRKKERVEKHYIGVDPGKEGGLAIIAPSGDVTLDVMPQTERDLWNWFDYQVWTFSSTKIVATIEKVHAMPKQGVSSTFTFGVGYGGLRMALTAAQIPFEEVTPRAWQKGLSIPPRKKHNKVRRVKNRKEEWVNKKYGGETDTQWKNRLRAKAQQLFPELALWREAKKEQLAVCDALLLAEYCRRKDQGKL